MIEAEELRAIPRFDCDHPPSWEQGAQFWRAAVPKQHQTPVFGVAIMSQPTVAVLGASTNRSKFGNKAVRAFLDAGWTVYPVNPRASEIEGLPCFRTLDEVPPGHLDRVSFYLPPAIGIQALDLVANRPVGEVWLNPGTASPALLQRADELGLNVVQGCSIIDVGGDPGSL
jgi:predicted CoA-binding protein